MLKWVLALMSVISFFSLAETIAVIEVDKGYIRETIPGTEVSSAYMTILNKSAQNLALVSVTSPVSPRLELHQHLMSEGMMKMRQVDDINIDANSEVVLKPSGFHIMIFSLASRLKAGDKIPLTLTFSNNHQLEILLQVESIKKNKEHHHHH
ncbi:MAG: copper chaperone PCu(A)C [Thalassotalea sp.]